MKNIYSFKTMQKINLLFKALRFFLTEQIGIIVVRLDKHSDGQGYC